LWKNDVANQAQLIGGTVGYVTSNGNASNVSNGGSIAQSGARNNYLKHTELARARALFDERERLQREITRLSNACLFCAAPEIAILAAQRDLIAIEINELQLTSAANTLAMIDACAPGNTTECQVLRAEAAHYLDNTNSWFGMEARLGAVFDVSADVLDGVEVDWGGNLDVWLTDQYDIAEVTPNADWGVISSTVAEHAIMRDGVINVGVGSAVIGVSVIGCIGTSGWGCAAIVGGAAIAESNTIYDGAKTILTGESQNGYIKNTLLSADFSEEDATKYELWIEMGLAVATIGVDGVVLIRSAKGPILATGPRVVDDLGHATNSGAGGFYNPRAWRQNYDDFYNGNVTSTTVPPYSAKNVQLAGQRHSETGVVFDQRGYPVFDNHTAYDTRFTGSDFSSSSYQTQMRMGTRDLRTTIESNPQLRSQFDATQLQAIQSGNAKVPGYTWHHHQDTGRMQLVDETVHRRTGHIGGEAMSGGQ
jgi:hypothetical protein